MRDAYSGASGVREVELAWIPMSDGVQLAARLFLPSDAEQHPVPAILEYIPYRRRDSTRGGDNLTHPWFASQGLASVRVDIRGTGDSEGVIRDEYLNQEQDDAVEVIDWISSQQWCSGAVGMMGISWGGFNSLQVAARRPEALKAVITVCSTDDRYADDMHYMGGAVITDLMAWGLSFFTRMGRSPDPLMVGEERWREMWRNRLEGWEPPFAGWLRHQARDDFWRHGSVCEDYSQISCAVLAVGGWADGYSNAIFRMLSGLSCPRKGIVGPWGHKYPHLGIPGPSIGFLQEAKRWWDHWLKGVETGIMDEPMLRAWIQESVPPASHYDYRPGYWAGEPAWPSANITEQSWGFGDCTLAPLAEDPGSQAGLPFENRSEGFVLPVASLQSVGQHAGEWCPYGMGGITPELPIDQREEDGGSLVFQTSPLEEEITIFGPPVIDLELEANAPNAVVIARLNDLRPDGSDLRVTYGVLNLTHRNGHAAPEAIIPGERFRARVQLNEIGHVFPAGHRIRLALSTAYWPIVWPSPSAVRLLVHTGGSRMILPLRSRRPEDESIRFEQAVVGRATPSTRIAGGHNERTIRRDLESDGLVHTVVRDEGRSVIDEIDVETGFSKKVVYRIKPTDPLSARVDLCEQFIHRHAQGWDTSVQGEAALSATESEFLVEATIKAFDAGQPFFIQSWLERIPRNGV